MTFKGKYPITFSVHTLVKVSQLIWLACNSVSEDSIWESAYNSYFTEAKDKSSVLIPTPRPILSLL